MDMLGIVISRPSNEYVASTSYFTHSADITASGRYWYYYQER